ncbi:UbiH/UbiF/VisC/COQ6 family ubiquinone biosynthesis hydroxylase [Bordetella genomosp. 1]|uniref:Monooxygenase n=1 Tax=Bordetella genomosp. 1 TaxID=1395607 RepID=A0ABX4F2H5_9BORD|nr:UbiH/UbiF/VisC/COQ6 family ubiquinone biosynthesis hydroxylase [Bordetella genomosp. 1]OZI65239.1 monooxygenase [Bordetella genomosp. 1]
MTPSVFDIAILGAGPVGQALALLLARAARDPARIALLATPSGASGAAPLADPRVLAMNRGSRVLLESLGAFPARVADIRHIHVSQRGRLGRTLIDHSDFDVPQLGSVVAYATLHESLAARVAASGVTVLSGPAARLGPALGEIQQVMQGDVAIACRVAVQCDGAGGADVQRSYGQHAVLTSARAALPRAGWAWERFTREGPLAMLPHPQAPDTYAVVWACAPERAAELATLDDTRFSAALTQAFGTRLGRLHSQAPRHVFPLELKARRAQVQGRCAIIGNAAQTLHPVAGQGLNLGLRDAAQLAQTLAPWLQAPEQNPAPLLAAFARDRSADRLLTASLTDLMPRIFATGLAPVEHACGLALLTLDLVPAVRAPLARHLLQGLRT